MLLLWMCAAGCASPPFAPRTAAVIQGNVVYRERLALPPDAIVHVRLVDISRPGAPARTVGEHVIRNPGAPPIPFAIRYEGVDIQPDRSYAIQAFITVDGKLGFTNPQLHTPVDFDRDGLLEITVERTGNPR